MVRSRESAGVSPDHHVVFHIGSIPLDAPHHEQPIQLRHGCNPYHAQTRRRDSDSLTKAFGEQVTADHIIASRNDSQGYDGSNYAVVIYDISTYFRDRPPTSDKDVIDARRPEGDGAVISLRWSERAIQSFL